MNSIGLDGSTNGAEEIEMLDDAGLNAHQTALSLRIPASRLTAIPSGKRSITAGTAMRLARFFGASAAMWINPQTRYDLQVAQDDLSEKLPMKSVPSKGSRSTSSGDFRGWWGLPLGRRVL